VVGQIKAAQFAVDAPGTLAQFRTAIWHVWRAISQQVGLGAGEQATPITPPEAGPQFPWLKAAVENRSVNRVRNILLFIVVEINLLQPYSSSFFLLVSFKE